MNTRHPKSPALLEDILRLQDLFQKNIESNALTQKLLSDIKTKVDGTEDLVKVSMKEAKQICGRAENTIRKHCKPIGVGFGGGYVYDKKDVEKLRR